MTYAEFQDKIKTAYPDKNITFAYIGSVMEAEFKSDNTFFSFQCLAYTDTIRGFMNGNPIGRVLE